MKYILELGFKEAKGSEGEQWISKGYYVDYTVKGPVISENKEDAYHFLKQEFAQNVMQGDERLKGRIVPVDE